MAILGKRDSHVSVVLKYTVFFCNFIFWLVGAGVVAVGIWTFIEKNRFNHIQIKSVYDAIFDISIVFIVVGIVIFILGLTGCVGALRENVCLLKFFYYFLTLIFLLLVAAAVTAFLMKDKFKKKLTDVIQENIITRYTYDDDAKSIIDWFQEQLRCCGVGPNGYKDWNQNEYFNCTNKEKKDRVSAVGCLVPYSCCKRPNDINEQLKNIMCGADVLALTFAEAAKKINTIGCVEAAITFIETHVPVVGGLMVAFTAPMLIAIFLARSLEVQISQQLGQA